MTEKKYRKWDEIINPALERSRMRTPGDPREERASAILDRLEGDSIQRAEKRKQPPDGSGEKGEERGADNEKSERGGGAPHPVHGGTRSRPSHPGSPNRQTILTDTAVRDENGELTPEEVRVLREKRAKIEQVMNEFVTWKESLK